MIVEATVTHTCSVFRGQPPEAQLRDISVRLSVPLGADLVALMTDMDIVILTGQEMLDYKAGQAIRAASEAKKRREEFVNGIKLRMCSVALTQDEANDLAEYVRSRGRLR